MGNQSSEGSSHPFSRLSPEKILGVLDQLNLKTDARIFALNSYENRVYQIGLTDGSSRIVKFYRPGRWNEAQILEEHKFCTELVELGVPVSAPLNLGTEGTLARVQGFYVAMFDMLSGRAPELDDETNLAIMGRFVGRIHAVGAQNCFSERLEFSPERLGAMSREFLLSNDFLPPELLRAYESLSQDLILKVGKVFESDTPLAQIRIHGDCHFGNVLWNEEVPHFVDFDDSITGPAIQDLWMMLSGSRNDQQLQATQIIKGYNEFYDFDLSEMRLVEGMRTLRLMSYSAWLARRWNDPTFPSTFRWFNTERYWSEHILELREQLALLHEPSLEVRL
jgi:Ser/Thr protein kinase RdoA (MazF antagonist)